MKIIEEYPGRALGDDLIRHGYAEKHPHEIKVCFDLTPEQLGADTTDHNLYDIICNEYMAIYMGRIAEKARCYQYEDKERLSYGDDWDLFFYHDSSKNKERNPMSSMDYFYFTLTFNKIHPQKRKEAILEMIMDVLEEYEIEGVRVTICYIAQKDKEKICKDAKAIAPTLIGKYVQYKSGLSSLLNPVSAFSGLPILPMEGRVVAANDQLYFVKKRARTRGYKLDNEDILRIFWNLEEKEA